MSARLMRNAAAIRRRSSVCEEIHRREHIVKPVAKQSGLPMDLLEEDSGSSEDELEPSLLGEQTAEVQIADLISAINDVHHRRVTGIIDEFMKAQIPILNRDKRDILMSAIKCKNLEILNVVTDVISPGRNFPNDYSHRLLMSALQTEDVRIVKKIASSIRFKFSMTKLEFYQLVEAAIQTGDPIIVKATLSVVGRRKFPNLLALQVLTDATKTAKYSIVVDVFKYIRPKKAVSQEDMMQLLLESIRTGVVTIVKVFFHWKFHLSRGDRFDTMKLATKSNKAVFDCVLENLNPVFSGTEWRELLHSATANRKSEIVSTILKTYTFRNETVINTLSGSIRKRDLPTIIAILKSPSSNLPTEIARDIFSVAIKFGCEELVSLVSLSNCFAVDVICDGILNALTLDKKTSTPNSSCNISPNSSINESLTMESPTEPNDPSFKLPVATDAQKMNVVERILFKSKIDHSIVIVRVLKYLAESDAFEAATVILTHAWQSHEHILRNFLLWAVKELENHKVVEATLRYSPKVSYKVLDLLLNLTIDTNNTRKLDSVILEYIQEHYPDHCDDAEQKETCV